MRQITRVQKFIVKKEFSPSLSPVFSLYTNAFSLFLCIFPNRRTSAVFYFQNPLTFFDFYGSLLLYTHMRVAY